MSDFSIKIPHQSANTDLVPADHVDITPEAIVTALRTYLRSNEFDKQLQEFAAFLAMKNDYYGDSWQVSGLITSLDDIVDKIFRVQTIRTHHGEVVGQRIIFPTKQENGYDLGDILKDVMFRALMGHLKFEAMNDKNHPLRHWLAHDPQRIGSDDPHDPTAHHAPRTKEIEEKYRGYEDDPTRHPDFDPADLA